MNQDIFLYFHLSSHINIHKRVGRLFIAHVLASVFDVKRKFDLLIDQETGRKSRKSTWTRGQPATMILSTGRCHMPHRSLSASNMHESAWNSKCRKLHLLSVTRDHRVSHESILIWSGYSYDRTGRNRNIATLNAFITGTSCWAVRGWREHATSL